MFLFLLVTRIFTRLSFRVPCHLRPRALRNEMRARVTALDGHGTSFSKTFDEKKQDVRICALRKWKKRCSWRALSFLSKIFPLSNPGRQTDTDSLALSLTLRRCYTACHKSQKAPNLVLHLFFPSERNVKSPFLPIPSRRPPKGVTNIEGLGEQNIS